MRRSAGMSPSDFDPVQLRRGTKVELEHTDSRKAAQRIAMDHLAEDPRYYIKLATIHHEDKPMAKTKSKRPPKSWWDSCVAQVKRSGTAIAPPNVCGATWRDMSPAAKRRAKRKHRD